MKTEKAVEILEEILAEYESKGRRDVVIVLKRARDLLAAHGIEDAPAPSSSSASPPAKGRDRGRRREAP